MRVKTISLDVHTEWCQLAVIDDLGEILLEMQVETKPDALRHVVEGIDGPKRVVCEHGPLSGMIQDALQDVVDEIVSCDPARNALIARAEDSNDERDTRRLALLSRAGALHPVYVPPEPYRTLRSLVHYDYSMARMTTSLKNTLKGLCRRHGVRYRGASVYGNAEQETVLAQLPSAAIRGQMESLYRRLNELKSERRDMHRLITSTSAELDEVGRLQSIPGIGTHIAPVLVAWIVNPLRFKNRKALYSYAGLGLGQGWTNWQPVGRARASKRGQRELKRVVFTAARSATHGDNALAKRYEARRAAGWEGRKAIRDVARTMLNIVRAVWITGKEYQDALVTIPK